MELFSLKNSSWYILTATQGEILLCLLRTSYGKKKKLVRTCSNSKKKNIKEYSSNLQDLLEEKMFMTPQRLYIEKHSPLKDVCSQ